MKNDLVALKTQLENCVSKIDEIIKKLEEPVIEPPIESPVEQPTAVEPVVELPASTDTEFEELKKLLESDKWPAAVDPALICDTNSEEDKLNRAEGILELLIEEPLKDKKFLDFGCGEGHTAYKAIAQEVTLSVGYDIIKNDNWAKYQADKLILTTNKEEVQQHAPFDVILIYDVIDHTTQEKASEILTLAKTLLADNGKIYMRTHPFSSRHATHLYHKTNKAFMHLVFTEDELQKLGLEKTEDHWKVVYPLAKYKALITNVNLKIRSNNVLRQQVEPFFKQQIVANKIIEKFNNKKFPDYQLEQQFLDYVLTK